MILGNNRGVPGTKPPPMWPLHALALVAVVIAAAGILYRIL